ncbi:pyridoxal phosphate homeostasis protein-like [Histomonas meleagridis]|uniref:pyridoxal phosphate homeostasis protein-like n=1 Tax=Histomonas meleagridis TaxID=135588 RepID=UPI003559A9A2|nr:pyridoxal phosphate homeostasis protein-like [Histomonas meleagridis]KAH0805631.1 pyridoxal phosphate homeostasis protein-like [Histomonas meleagridis]
MGSIGENYQKIAANVKRLNPNTTLVSVSKLKPIEDLREAFEAGCRVFGENYVDELVEKAPQLPDAKFHLIGHLQTNKVAKVCRIPNLGMIETIDSIKLATKVNNSYGSGRGQLSIMVQVNTSQEPQKHGIQRGSELFELIRYITSNCPNLKFEGLMTIGETGESERDFNTLIDIRKECSQELQIPLESIKLSMGMSADYELACTMGADYVRVGSSIFGARPPKQTHQ